MKELQDKLGQESAFACVSNDYLQEGISKRFYAACFAMQGLLASGAINLKSFIKPDYNIIIKDSYKLADELLKQENED